jgi:superfamily I DNA and/or RNA helicase
LVDLDLITTDPSTIKEELHRVRALMQLEQKEDLAQFKLKNAKASIQERQRRGFTWYPITITKEDIGFGGKVLLELERPAGQQGLHLFQVGKNASLFGHAPTHSADDRPTLNGVITSVRRNKLLLSTNKEELPDWVLDGGKLGIDLTFDEVSYREMNHALDAVIGAHGNRLAELRDVLLGARQPRYHAPKTDDLFYPSPLNASQLAAVRHVMAAQDVAIIHGPPGTGKTTTLVQAILETTRRERRVLVCAPSNTAVDLLTEKLAERGVNVIRMGNPSRVSDLLLNHTLDAKVMTHSSYSKMRAMRQTADQYRETASEYVRNFGFEECQQRRLLKEEARMLNVQYRMHEQIMGFSSEQFYGGQLEAHPSVRHTGLSAYDLSFAPDLPVEFLDTAGFGFLEITIPESRSTANPEEADVLLKRLAQLLEPFEQAEHQQHPLTIGVIAPYRAQINYLKDAIEENDALNGYLQDRMLSVGTVDSFQGQERDIIAISLTRSNRNSEIGFLADIRRMNVGMTRARRKLLLVGDSSTLCAHPFFKELLAYVERIGGYRTAWEMA